MESSRVIVRTVSNLSYAGEICNRADKPEEGIEIKPSEKSGIKIWFPLEEIQCVIKMDGNVLEGEELKDECRLH